MVELPAPILTTCIVLPLAAAMAASGTKEDSRARHIAIGALGATLVLLLEVLRRVSAAGGAGLVEPWALPLFADGLSVIPMALFTGIALVTLIAAPRRDANGRFVMSLLTLTAATLTAYAASNLAVLLAGWMIPVVLFRRRGEQGSRMPGMVLAASGVSLAIAIVLIAMQDDGGGVAAALAISGNRTVGVAIGPWVAAFLVFAAILRDRIFPFHRATVALFEGHPILLAALLINSHLGIFLIARVALPLFPGIAEGALPWLGGLALFTTLYTAVLGIAERQPGRVLALLIVSQSSAILAGLATASHEGIGGALLQWVVLGVSSTVLITVYRSLEVRIDGSFDGRGFMGLAARMPRLAVFFAISGLAMVGLPGTLGFPGEDLLIHGVMAHYAWWGAALPVAIALNAYHAFRLFARLFLGKDDLTKSTVADALPRERWALTACLTFLVWGGLVPRQIISLQASATSALVQNAEPAPNLHP